MFMNMRSFVLALAITLLAGCSSAPKSSEVASCYVPSYRYSSLSCDQLINAAENLRARTPALASAVDAHRKTQTGVEVVTWVLFWPAALLLDKGAEQSNALCQAKGELEAIQQVLSTKDC